MNSMKGSSFVLPNNVVPPRIYNEINTNNLDNADIYEYCNNKLNASYLSTVSSHPPLYREKVFYKPSIIKGAATIQTYNPPDAQRRKLSCLNSFPCLRGNFRSNNPMNSRHAIKANNNDLQGRISKGACFLNNNNNNSTNSNNNNSNNNKPTVMSNGFEKNVYDERFVIPVSIDSHVRSIAPYVQSNTRENYANFHNEKMKEMVKNKIYNNEPFKKRVSKEKLPEPIIKNKINELIREKDEQIKELERNIEKEKQQNEIEDNDLMDNQKLKERLLDQKIKYEETLKHLKKVETEKRTLKSSLNVRDKVLTKLESEIGSVDMENDFLLKLKENTSLNDIHNIFKCLHGGVKGMGMNRSQINEKNENQINGKNEKKINVKNGRKQKNAKWQKGEKTAEWYKSEEVEDLDDSELSKKKDDKSWYKTRSTCEDILLSTDDITNSEKRTYSMKEKKISKMKTSSFESSSDVYSLKSTIVELEKEIYDLKEENKNVNFKYENTFEALSELRKDTLEYMESIVSRDMRIAYMESMLQKCERDLTKLREHFRKQQISAKEKIEKLISEIKILEKQSSHLQSMIQEKDSQIVLLKSEIVRNEILVKQYEERNKELQSELRLMCTNLENVIDASNKKDLFMNELEKQIRENEVHRQNAYLKEVAKNRKIHANMKFKEILYDKSAKHQVDELHNLKKELYLNKIQMQKAKDAFEVLKNVPKSRHVTKYKGEHNSVDIDNSIVHNFSEYKNEKNTVNTTFEEKVSTDVGIEYKPKNSVVKKKKKKETITTA
ncbi:protein AAP4 [Plasmodium brasilianum]|nr:conserved Plasmodium protein, unknown function [Plasmodium malariae]KAI4834743.1 protein AAP4 [Plasmodium brasilianum]SCP03300.1 conserved Plasmodium protein, unknown function [Plasmodium malariae]